MKRLLSTILLLSFFSAQVAPVQAALKSGVSETRQAKQEAKAKLKAQQKADKELYKRVKAQKDLPYKKYKVVNKYDFINMPWWEQFNDPCLNSYINRAMEYNHDLKMASLTVDEYFQSVKAQMANELPKVQLGFGGGVAGIPPVGKNPNRDTIHGVGLPIMASYEADIFLKNHDKTTAQKKAFQASVSDERATYIAIVSAVGTVYYNIVRLDKIIALQEDIVNLRKEIFELMSLRNDLIDLKRQRVELLNQLAVLIGDSPENIDSFDRIAYENINYSYTIPAEISSDVIIQRPDYIKSEMMLKKAGIDVRVAKKEFLPTISIDGLALFNAVHLGSLFTTKNSILGVAGSAMQPIFTGGALIANLKINKIRFEKAIRNYQKTNLVAIQEVNDALYKARMDNKKLEQNKEHYKLENQDFGLTQLKYEQGVISKLDLCQMKENLLVIEKLVASNTLDCRIDEINLYKATGTKY